MKRLFLGAMLATLVAVAAPARAESAVPAGDELATVHVEKMVLQHEPGAPEVPLGEHLQVEHAKLEGCAPTAQCVDEEAGPADRVCSVSAWGPSAVPEEVLPSSPPRRADELSTRLSWRRHLRMLAIGPVHERYGPIGSEPSYPRRV